jgi:Holliday junction resolvase RusA-like endonuclease
MRLDRTPPLRWWSAVIEGEPASKANSRRVVRRGRFTRVIKSEKALSYVAQLREQIAPLPPERMLRGRLCLTAYVFYASNRPDLDISLILDALQGLVYTNDRQVREMHLHHHIDRAQPRTRLHIMETTDDDE